MTNLRAILFALASFSATSAHALSFPCAAPADFLKQFTASGTRYGFNLQSNGDRISQSFSIKTPFEPGFGGSPHSKWAGATIAPQMTLMLQDDILQYDRVGLVIEWSDTFSTEGYQDVFSHFILQRGGETQVVITRLSPRPGSPARKATSSYACSDRPDANGDAILNVFIGG